MQIVRTNVQTVQTLHFFHSLTFSPRIIVSLQCGLWGGGTVRGSMGERPPAGIVQRMTYSVQCILDVLFLAIESLLAMQFYWIFYSKINDEAVGLLWIWVKGEHTRSIRFALVVSSMRPTELPIWHYLLYSMHDMRDLIERNGYVRVRPIQIYVTFIVHGSGNLNFWNRIRQKHKELVWEIISATVGALDYGILSISKWVWFCIYNYNESGCFQTSTSEILLRFDEIA